MVRRRLRRSRMVVLICGLVVTAVALVSASGVLADATPAGPQSVRAQLAYNCQFPAGPRPVSSTPAGPRPVSITVAATFPSAAVAGKPIKVSGLRTTVAVPRPIVAQLRKLGVTGVTGRAVTSAAVADNATTVTALWPGRLAEPVPLPASDRLRLTFSGTVPPVAVSAPGTVTFAAARLSLALTLRTANVAAGGANMAAGGANMAAGHTAELLVTCTPAPGTATKLAAVPVTAPPRPGRSPGGKRGPGAVTPSSGTPSGCAKRLIHGGTPNPVLGCAHLLGYADVGKLQESALVGPAPDGNPPAAFLNVDTYQSDVGCVPVEPTLAACIKNHGVVHAYNCSVAQLDYNNQLAFPPTRATFLNFGFVPVTAVMQLSQTAWPSSHPPTENPKCYRGFSNFKPVPLPSPVITVFTDLNDSPPAKFPVLNISGTYLTIHISQVAVNGVPLNVGPNCGTTQPIHAVLTGRGFNGPPPTGYTLATGGPLTGSVTIPAFEHCGVGENLDPLFDASISGPMNFQLMTQGTLCTPQETGKPGCPPTVPKPRRHV
jgi:hypothetical protein